MNTPNAIQAIHNCNSGRFEFEPNTPNSKQYEIAALCPEDIVDRDVIRLRRLSRAVNAGGGWRTILVIGNVETDGIPNILKWTALTREVLPDPEASDLYLMVFGGGIVDHQARTLELGESFCRKFIRMENEDITSFINRTFLASDPIMNQGDLKSDLRNPLGGALQELVKREALTEEQAQSWRKSMITIQGGQDLAAQLKESLGTPKEVQ